MSALWKLIRTKLAFGLALALALALPGVVGSAQEKDPNTKAETPVARTETAGAADAVKLEAEAPLGAKAKEGPKVEISIGPTGVKVDAGERGDASGNDPGRASVKLDFDFGQATGRERVAVGNKVTVKADETVREVVVVLGSAVVDGDVEHDVVVVCGEATINGKIEGQLISILSSVELGPNAEVEGETVVVGKPLKVDPQAKLTGQIHEVTLGEFAPKLEWFKRNIVQGILLRPLAPHVTFAWILAACFFALHFLVALLLGRPVQVCAQTLVNKPVRSFFVGILVAVLSLPMLIVLSPTLVGPPLWICALLVASLIGKVGVYTATGSQLGRQLRLQFLEPPLIAFIAGTLLFYLLYMVPVLGWFAWLVITPLGVGAAVLAAASGLSREGREAKPVMLSAIVPPPPGSPPPPGEETPASPTSPTSPPAGTPAPPPPSGLASLGATAAAVPPLVTPPPLLALASPDLSGLPRVGFWPRLGATALDFIPVAIVSSFFGGFPAFVIISVAYHVGMWFWRGATLGGVVLGLKVIRLDGRPLDWPTAVVRSLSSFVSLFAVGLGFFWASWSDEHQSWHDIIAGTTIVKLPKLEAIV